MNVVALVEMRNKICLPESAFAKATAGHVGFALRQAPTFVQELRRGTQGEPNSGIPAEIVLTDW
jgi:hypothetical protein